MNGKYIVLFTLALLVAGLAFLNPAWFRKAGDFLNFGLTSANKISPEELNQKLSASRIGITESKAKFVAGDVFSRYPLNLKDQILVDVGSADGVKFGGAAISDGILVGKVVGVSGDTSVIQTVFDPSFSIAVRIGKSKTDALLRGGVEPKLTLIPKTSVVEVGDAVYSASKDFEYGLPLGVLGPIGPTSQNIFSEADLILSYSPADLRYLFLEKQ
jgi:cell shape-determining protein MreC